MKILSFTLFAIVFLLLASTTEATNTNCNLIYGGGVGNNCVEMQKNPAQLSKLPVYPSQNLTNSPATGPQSLILISLIPLGILGFRIRKNAIKLSQ